MKSALLSFLICISGHAQPSPVVLTNMVPRLVLPRTNWSVTFAWNPVSNAASYRVYLGTNSRSYTQFADTTGTQARMTNLAAGTYYAAPTCFNAVGVESDYGDEFKFGLPLSNTVLSVVAADCAASIEGPWSSLTNIEVFRGTNVTETQFFKLRIEKTYF